jgi:hypothetical protein
LDGEGRPSAAVNRPSQPEELDELKFLSPSCDAAPRANITPTTQSRRAMIIRMVKKAERLTVFIFMEWGVVLGEAGTVSKRTFVALVSVFSA